MVKWVNDKILEERLNLKGVVAVAFLDRTEKSSQLFFTQFEEVGKAFYGQIQCCAVDAVENPTPKIDNNAYNIPLIILFRDGNELGRYEAQYNYKQLCEQIKQDIQPK